MNRQIIFSLLVALFSICLPLQAIPGTSRTVIKGIIINRSIYPKTKVLTLKIIDFRGKETLLKDSIKKDGTFQFAFDLYIAQDISIEPIVGKFIAHPGDNILLGIDFKNIGYVSFNGNCQKTNQELYKYLNGNYLTVNYDPHKMATLEPEAYKIYCESVKNQMSSQRQRFIKEVNPGSEVLKWTNNYVKINYLQSLLYYSFYNILDPTSDYFNFLDQIGSVFSTTLLNTDAYELLNGYSLNTSLRFIKDFSTKKDSNVVVLINHISQNQPNKILKQALIGNIFYQNLNEKNLNFFATNKNLFDENIQESFIRKPLETYFQTQQEELENPQKATNTIYKRMTNLSGKLLLDSIITANKGKVLYLDFWFRGFKSCTDDFVYTNKLTQDYQGKNFDVVYISLDPNIVEGELELMRYQVKGSHVYCNYFQNLSFNKGFEIRIVPFYVLINKKGLIVESGNQLVPHIYETTQKIDKLISEK